MTTKQLIIYIKTYFYLVIAHKKIGDNLLKAIINSYKELVGIIKVNKQYENQTTY